METIDEFLQEWHNENPYIIAHTSGSTGTPKEIRLLKSDMRQSARATNAYFRITPSSTLASPLSTAYIAGKMMVVRALEAGCRIIQLPIANNITLPDDSPRIDLLPIVPSQAQSLIDRPEYAFRIRNLLIGGAAPDQAICHQLNLLGYNTHISYGMTETCSHVALRRADDTTQIFHALPGITFTATDDSRLIINAPSFSFQTIATNDIADIISPTAMRLRGRADSAINSGGLKLFPEELEALYRPHLPNIDFYITSIPHHTWGQAVAMVIEGNENQIPAINDKLREKIADHRLLPKHYTAVEALPRTPNGKIIRHK